MREFFSAHSPWRIGCLSWLLIVAGLLSPIVTFSQEATNAALFSVMELDHGCEATNQTVFTGRVQGVVRAVVPEKGFVALQDQTGATLLALPQVNPAIKVGDEVEVDAAPCLLSRTRFGIRMEDFLVVDDDGLHPATEKKGGRFLNAGFNPIRLEWFNGPTEFALNLEIEGPGISRRGMPGEILWHRSSAGNVRQSLEQGLYYQAYEGVGWRELPNFALLKPIMTGVATNFSTTYRTRDQGCALTFNGYIQINQSGYYTFYLKSDDGSKFYVGAPSISCKLIKPVAMTLPAPESLEQALADHGNNHWIQMEGEVTFCGQEGDALILELMVGGNHIPVTVLDGANLLSTNLLHRWVQVQGICEFSRDPGDKRLVGIFVPGMDQVKIRLENARLGETNDVLTSAAQIRRLKSDESGKHLPVKIHGVVIFSSPTAAVLQDSSGGVFISYRAGYWIQQPKLGEVWEIQGTTDTGLFSPVVTANNAQFLGYAPLPEPIQPTRDQLINGNMDAEYGELRGVITSVSSNQIDLLTADGKVSVVGNEDRPLPKLPDIISSHDSPIGSVVQIRGCFAPMVDTDTRQVISGKTYIYPALLEVEDPAPKDPFQLPARTPSDLMWFNARAMALERTKLKGQILCSPPGEYLVADGKNGFRVLTPNSSLSVGDLIEAVGFPDLDGPSPILQEAQVRRIGHAALPAPVMVSPEKLLDHELDSTLVEVRAFLVSDTVRQGERVLELQNGPQHFMARQESVPGTYTPLPAGSRLQLTGVYASTSDDRGPVGQRIAPFELLVNSPNDIMVLQRPSWWTIQRALFVLIGLLGVLSMTFIWVALLRRKVEQRTMQLKQEIEQRQFVEQRHAIELERARVARDLHDELGAGLTEVGLLGSLANTPAVEPEAKNRYLNQLTQMARSLVASLDEIVWAVNPHYDSLTSLVSYFSLYAESFLGLAGIACRLRVAEYIPQHPLDAKQRHGVFCVFKEALNNAIRHSNATEVQIVFEVIDGKLVLSIIDNGCGFKPVPAEPGKDGLSSLRQRMEELGGGCQITSDSDQGTTVRISLPLNPN